MKWCFDTSALIEPWQRRYPPDVFGSVWDTLEELANKQLIIAPEEVKFELAAQKDDLYNWACGLNGFFAPTDRKLIELQAEIVNDHPGLIKYNSTKSGADAWVIALAEMHGIPVVTYENKAKKNAAPRIPDVCEARGLKVVDLVDVLRNNGFKV